MHSYIISGDRRRALSRGEMAAAALVRAAARSPAALAATAAKRCSRARSPASIRTWRSSSARRTSPASCGARSPSIRSARSPWTPPCCRTRPTARCIHLFPEADTMNIAAQNAFLKLLRRGRAASCSFFCAESREKAARNGAVALRGDPARGRDCRAGERARPRLS